ncbi:MAG TPA: hypothetical protein VMV68_00295 [Spirochaetia bacterium]|nr:hypothetical protein [Spirochaetia bacterium]
MRAARLPREIRLFILGALGAAALAVIITVIAMSAGRRPQAPVAVENGIQKSLSSLDLSDFQFPNSFIETWRPKWYPSRQQEKKWTWTEVEQFWIDPRTSVIKSLSEENDSKMESLFGGVK